MITQERPGYFHPDKLAPAARVVCTYIASERLRALFGDRVVLLSLPTMLVGGAAAFATRGSENERIKKLSKVLLCSSGALASIAGFSLKYGSQLLSRTLSFLSGSLSGVGAMEENTAWNDIFVQLANGSVVALSTYLSLQTPEANASSQLISDSLTDNTAFAASTNAFLAIAAFQIGKVVVKYIAPPRSQEIQRA